MFGIGGGEILVIALVALILFGTDDLPKNMRKFMKAWNDFRGATNDLQRNWLDVREQVTRDILRERPPPSSSTDSTQPTATDSAPLGSEGTVSDSSPTDEAAIGAAALPAEALAEGKILDANQQSELTSPQARPAQGALARGQLDEASADGGAPALNSAQDPDKST